MVCPALYSSRDALARSALLPDAQCILSGADAYLLKPLRVHELTNIWQYVWRRRHELQLMQQVSSLRTEAGDVNRLLAQLSRSAGMPPPRLSVSRL